VTTMQWQLPIGGTGARTYASGLVAPLRTLVRTGVINLLAPLLRLPSNALGFATTIAEMPFKIEHGGRDDFEIDVLMDILNNRAPAYAVALGDSKNKAAGMAPSQGRATIEIDVYSFCGHARNIVLGRLAADGSSLAYDAYDPGIEVMMEVARQLVDGARLNATLLGTKASEITWTGEANILTTKDKTVWAQTYTIDVVQNLPDFPGVTRYLTLLDAQHRIGASDPPNPLTPPLIHTDTTVP
jgi:hypothetical protein